MALRTTVDKRGQPLGTAENIPFGPVITDKKDVEERIRRAQRAILNPSISHEIFLSGKHTGLLYKKQKKRKKGLDVDLDGGSELSFSKNCVYLELSGPDLTDLSFCDLQVRTFLASR